MIDRNIIRTFLQESKNAKCDEYELKRLYGKEVVFIENKKTDTQAFATMIPNSRKMILSCRGTEQEKIRDWVTDLSGIHVRNKLVIPYGNKDSDIRVHYGFITAYQSIRKQIHDFINKHKPEEIFVVGHSLGGILAVFAAVDIQYNFEKLFGLTIHCFPSGNPKGGNKAFMESYNRRVPNTYRTYIPADLVPKLPPAFLEFFFRQKSYHVGIPNKIGPKNIFVGIFNWFKRKDKKGMFLQDLTNHSIDLYLKHC